MALIAIASDKGAPGVTTAALALAAVWPRPVLLAECDPAGGDLVYRFPAVGGGHLDPRRGVLSLAVVARRGMAPRQVWEHAQKLPGGLDVLAGVTNAEQGAGLSLLWGPIGKVLAALPQADVIADCGRLGADGPLYDLLAEATTVVLVTKVQVADVIRLRDRAAAFAAAAARRGRRGFGVGVVVVADHKKLRAALGEVQHVLSQANTPATVLGGIAQDSKGADLLGGEWGGNLDRTLLIKTAREVAQRLLPPLPPIASQAPARPPAMNPQAAPPAAAPPASMPPAAPSPASMPPAAVPLTAQDLPAGGRASGDHRTAFSRVLGTRSGRHQADPGQALYGSAPPVTSVPVTSVPVTAGPGTSAPVAEAPVISAPVVATPVTGAQFRDTPVTGAQGSDIPVSDIPVSDPPVTDPPVTDPPVSESARIRTGARHAQGPADHASWTPALAESSEPADEPASPNQEDTYWGGSGWQHAPGPMGSSRPGRG